MKKNYETLLFDLDDTLIDIVQAEHIGLLHIHENFYNSLQFDEFKKYYQKINRALWDNLGQPGSTLRPKEIKYKRFIHLNEELELNLDIETVAEEYEKKVGKSTNWLPGAKNAIEFLHQQGYTLGIVTNGVTSLQYLKYERHLLNNWFKCFIVSDEVGVSKPGSEIFSLAFSQLSNLSDSSFVPQPEKTLFIGDSLISDGQGARNCKMDFCYINANNLEIKDSTIPIKFNITSVSRLPKCLGHDDFE